MYNAYPWFRRWVGAGKKCPGQTKNVSCSQGSNNGSGYNWGESKNQNSMHVFFLIILAKKQWKSKELISNHNRIERESKPGLNFFFFLKILFIHLRGKKYKGRQRGRSRLLAEQRAWQRAQYKDSRIMTWAKGRCLTDWGTQVPQIWFKSNYVLWKSLWSLMFVHRWNYVASISYCFF